MLSHGISAAAVALFVAAVTADDPSACAAVASASASYLSAHPAATTRPPISAEIAHECLNSVPNYKDPALALTNGLKSWFQIQSTIDYLKNPPSGYLWPSIDMVGQLDVILGNINDGKYDSEYDFQMDLTAYSYLTRDFHFGISGDLFKQITFTRSEYHLISLSSDGEQIPDVWIFEDLFHVDKDKNVIPTNCTTCSPVTQINGIDVQDFLTYSMNVVRSHDPDAMYNQIMWNAAFNLNPEGGPSSPWSFPEWYPGPNTAIALQNGSTFTIQNLAIVQSDWTGIETGDDVYQTFCVPEGTSSQQTPTKRDMTSDKTRRAATSAVTVLSSYPEPVAIDPSGVLSGYYLDGDLNNVAVLVIRAFESKTKNFELGFQNTLSDFLTQAMNDKMEYLVLDLQGNGGGLVDLGTELVAQLFPTDEPNAKSTMRQSTGLSAVITKFGQIQDAIDANSSSTVALNDDNNNAPWAWQSVTDPSGDSIGSNKAYLTSPYNFDGAEFTAYFQNNYSNTNPSDSGARLTITGTNERTGFSQPFSAQNIIILTDGYCGSTCTIATEMLKNLHGIQFITVGGRPQSGPSQPVGSSKGAQVFVEGGLRQILDAWYDDSQFPISRGTVPQTDLFANEQWNNFTLARGLSRLNGRNNYRIGDDSNTPKQMIYEASDCRMWYTADMISDPTVLWSQTADLAFNKRDNNGLISSPLCVADSVGQPTSGSGGLKRGQIGPQQPPAGAASKFPSGWLLNGTTVVHSWSPNRRDGGGVGVVDGVASNQDPNTFYLIGSSSSSNSTDDADIDDQTDGEFNDSVLQEATQQPLSAMHSACQGYNGDKWLMALICNMYG